MTTKLKDFVLAENEKQESKKSEHVCFQCSPEILNRIRYLKFHHGFSISSMMRIFVESGLTNLEKQVESLKPKKEGK